jgi:putative ABC transport system permease protein
VEQRLRDLVATLDQTVRVRSDQRIREESMEVFDRTFTVTRVLRLLAIGVAFIGILNALMALQMERARDYAVLRASGMTPSDLTGLILRQTALLGLAAGLFALPLGVLMAELLIEVVNWRSFGWTIHLQLSPLAMLAAAFLAPVAALLAGIYPAWQVRRAQPADALRDL